MPDTETIPEPRIPITNYKDIVEYHAALAKAEKNVFKRFESKHFDRHSLEQAMRKERLVIGKKYSRKLSGNDYYPIKSLEGLKSFLMSCSDLFSFDKEEIMKSVLHENDHYQKAKSFGCSLKGFPTWLGICEQEKEIRYLAVTLIKFPENIERSAHVEIALAPQNPSYLDKILAS